MGAYLLLSFVVTFSHFEKNEVSEWREKGVGHKAGKVGHKPTEVGHISTKVGHKKIRLKSKQPHHPEGGIFHLLWIKIRGAKLWEELVGNKSSKVGRKQKCCHESRKPNQSPKEKWMLFAGEKRKTEQGNFPGLAVWALSKD